jgi:hypothetical protein
MTYGDMVAVQAIRQGGRPIVMSMRRLVLLSILAAAVVTATGVASAGAAPKAQTIRLLEVDNTFQQIGGWSGDTAPTVGQGFVSTGVFYRWAGTKRGAAVGHVQILCTVTVPVSFTSETGPSGWFHCDVTALLPGGKIEVSGALNIAAKTNRLPLVGGTGKYVGVQGYVSTTDIGGDNSDVSADVIHITN